MEDNERKIERLLETMPKTRKRRRRAKPVTVTRSDGSVEMVKSGYFIRAKRAAKRKEKRTRYGNYLRSSHWKDLRSLALDRDRACVQCGATEHLQVHHLTYARLGKERLADLTTLCRACHKRHHGHGC